VAAAAHLQHSSSSSTTQCSTKCEYRIAVKGGVMSCNRLKPFFFSLKRSFFCARKGTFCLCRTGSTRLLAQIIASPRSAASCLLNVKKHQCLQSQSGLLIARLHTFDKGDRQVIRWLLQSNRKEKWWCCWQCLMCEDNCTFPTQKRPA
jgi:hypothetical protein